MPAFVAAQLAGLLVGIGPLAVLYPSAGQAAGEVVVPSVDSETPKFETRRKNHGG